MKINRREKKCIRYLTNEMSQADRAVFEIELALDHDLKNLYENYSLIWKHYPIPEQIDDPNYEAKQSLSKDSSFIKDSKQRWSKKYIAISAFALAILTISVFIYHSQDINYTNQIVTEKGERRSLYLPDSTLVVLNSLSEIHFPNAFNKTRDVFVSGEVFFDVTHNEEKPFTVHTTDLDVQVLGTAFNVNTSSSNKIISLERGKVNVLFKESNNQLTLSPNEQLIYNNATNDITKKNFNAIEVLGWKDEMLILDKTPFIEAIKKLNQFYGVTFRLKDKTLESKKITGAFKGLDIKGVISSLEFIANITIVPIHKNEYLIIGNDAN